MDNHQLSLIVPAFNEEKTIETVLNRIFHYLPDVHEVVVVDDASEDRTPEVCHEYADREPRVKLFRHKINIGKTAALQTGFAAVTGSIVVVQDADLEYDPREIPDLITPIKEGAADVCLGSRFLVRRAGRVLYYRHFLANKFLTFINNLLTDLNLTDVETGYKASRAEIAKNMIIESSGFGFEIEFVAKCKKIGARMYEVPISYYGRTYEEGKKVGLTDGFDALWYLVKFNVLTGSQQSFRKSFLEAWQSRGRSVAGAAAIRAGNL
ncbi:MAG: glycosyltransferase family 2 protein [Verrucomicrobia bacterium]|nr:glycosyltransferase family 2 protein [Verrucomicrobiota bacterium]